MSAINNAMTYLIDTAKAIRRIEESGVAHKQAAAIVETFADANEQIATKADIENLATTTKADVENLRNDMNAKIDNLRTEIKRLEALIQSSKSYLLFRMLLMQIGGIGLLFTLIKFFG